MKKGISIIMPCYNRVYTIGRSIESILNQKFDGDFEIVVSDDGSSDNSIEVAASYGDKVIIVEKPSTCSDKGASATRNRGIEKAHFEYIMFLDSDDCYLEDMMQNLFNAMELDNSLGFAFCRSKKCIVNPDGSTTISNWTRKRINMIDEKYVVLSRAYVMNTNTIIVRKSIFNFIGGFDTTLSNGNDSDMWIRISEVSRGKFIDFYGAIYYFDDNVEQLTKNAKSIVQRCSMYINTQSLGRYLLSGDVDKIRLYLITKQFVIKNYHKYPIFKNNHKLLLGCSLLKMIYLFPMTYVRYVVKSRFSVFF